jgi:chromosomal replication initiator protein
VSRPYRVAMPGVVSIATVLQHVAFETNRDVAEILSPSRKQPLTLSRYAAAWLARRHTGKTFAQIGRAFGNRDHSTISHEVARAEQLRDTDEYFAWLTDHLDSLLVAA